MLIDLFMVSGSVLGREESSLSQTPKWVQQRNSSPAAAVVVASSFDHTIFLLQAPLTVKIATTVLYKNVVEPTLTAAQASVGRDGHDKVLLRPLGRVDAVLRHHRRLVQLRRPRLQRDDMKKKEQ